MKKHYSIAIPKPCHEDWNKMSPRDKGKFCSSCSKTVVDFTKMNTYEIQDFIHQNKNKRVCGHFKQAQLDSINLHIPSKVLEQRLNFHKLFLLALLITMGTSLMNCTNKNGNSQKIDSIEVIDTLNNNKVLNVLEGLPVIEKIDSVPERTCSSSKSKKNNSNHIEKKLSEAIDITGDIEVIDPPIVNVEGEIVTVGIIVPNIDKNDPMPYHMVDTPPEFKDTDKTLSAEQKKKAFNAKLSKFVNDNFELSSTTNLGLSGRQRINTIFKIDSLGFIKNIRVRAPHPSLENHTIKTLKRLPQLKPAIYDGKPVSTIYALPIVFVLE